MNVAAPSLYKGDLVQGGTATTEIPGGLGRYGEQLPSTRAQVNIPRFASIKQLDERLSSINNQLSGAYDKEGVAQQNALSQTDKIALRAEAAQIREVLNTQLGTRTGLGKDAVAKARQDFGQLGDIQRKLELAVNKQRYGENLQLQKPVTPEDVTAAGLARQGFIKGARKIIGTPQERTIRRAF